MFADRNLDFALSYLIEARLFPDQSLMPELLSRDGLVLPFMSLSVFWWSILPRLLRTG
jgi:hypothetical protein